MPGERFKARRSEAKLASTLCLQEEGYDPRIITFGQELPINGDIIASLDLESGFFRDLSEKNLQYFQLLCRQLKKQNLLWLMPPFQINCIDPHGSQSLGMIRTARSELALFMTTLKIDPNAKGFVHHVVQILRETRKETSNGALYPDREYVVHDDLIKVS